MATATPTDEGYKTPMQVAWEFDYDVHIAQIENLYEKAKELQWNVTTDIDWDQGVDPSRPILEGEGFGFSHMPFFQRLSQTQQESLRAHTAAHRLSQFLHGEQGALMTAAVLSHSVPDYEAKLYSATQTMDEARHVEVFEKYVERIGVVYPISPFLKGLIDATLQSGHWVKIAIGMNIVIEGLAMGAFYNMRRISGCKLLSDIVDLTMRDEARHVAFGNVYVGKTLKNMHPDDREDAADFALVALSGMAPNRERGGDARSGGVRRDPTFVQVLENCGIDADDFAKGVEEAREQGIALEPKGGTVNIMRDLVMPALSRVGAITDRTRAILKERGIALNEDTTVLESLEDVNTGVVEL
ncbi:MAG: ferritin-like domain-containing protein [Deltaproteobacteria bacterium]|nr:ferritin-like domain-containing protein [Deltaproteobacteria bacterium]